MNIGRTGTEGAAENVATLERVQTRSLAKRCASCGQEFPIVRSHQKYCRKSCRLAGFKVRAAEGPWRGGWEPDPGRPE
jgi:hypothetical protein